MAFAALAALTKGGSLEPFSYEPAALGPNDVEIDVTHCGLCHSDIHLIDDAWNAPSTRRCPGTRSSASAPPRAAGSPTSRSASAPVSAGSAAPASRVSSASAARRTSAASRQATCMGNHGGLATRSGSTARFAFAIPDADGQRGAAPLLCGGVTVYSPMRRFGVTAASQVGGDRHRRPRPHGARSCCARSAARPTRSRPRRQARRGAGDGGAPLRRLDRPQEIRRHFGRFDLILSTVHAKLDWITYLQTLRPNGTLCLLGCRRGHPGTAGAACRRQRSITGSESAAGRTIREMLGFAARHRITPSDRAAAVRRGQRGDDAPAREPGPLPDCPDAGERPAVPGAKARSQS